MGSWIVAAGIPILAAIAVMKMYGVDYRGWIAQLGLIAFVVLFVLLFRRKCFLVLARWFDK